MSRPAGLALRVLLAHLAEELGVVVDLLDVLRLGAVLLLELLEGAAILLDVERPVGEVQRVGDLALGDRLGLGALGLGAAARLRAARGQPGQGRHAQRAGRAPLHQAAAGEGIGQEPLQVALEIVVRWRHAGFSCCSGPGVAPARLSHDVDVLVRPGEARRFTRPGELAARVHVRVGHEHGHARLVAQADDHLRGGAQIERALDLALDAGPPVVAGRARLGQHELLGADHGVGALAGLDAAGLGGAHGRPGVEAQLGGRAVARQHLPGHEVGHADETGHEGGRRALVDGLGVGHLLDQPAVHHRDAVRHRERLFLIVRDVHEGDADVALDALELHLQLLAELEVERAERLVEQQHGGTVHQRARQRHPLLLAAGQLGRAPLGLGGEADPLQLLRGAAPGLGPVHPLALEPEGDVLLHAEMWKQRVALEHGVGRALEGRAAGHVLAVQQDPALGGLLEAGDHAEGRGLAAAGGAEHGEELAPRDLQVEIAHRGEIAKTLRYRIHADARRVRRSTLPGHLDCKLWPKRSDRKWQNAEITLA